MRFGDSCYHRLTMNDSPSTQIKANLDDGIKALAPNNKQI